MWDYVCPKCKREVKQKSHKCPYCGENYGVPLRVPPKVLKDSKALEEYVHKHIFPKVSASQREYLAKFFTEIFSDGFESGDFSAWTTVSASPPSIVTTPVHHGTYALESDGPSEWIYKDLGASYDTLYMRAYVRWTALEQYQYYMETAFGIYNSARWAEEGDRGGLRVAVTNYGTPQLSLVIALGVITSVSTTAPNINQWYCYELVWVRNGVCRLYVDGVDTLQVNGTDYPVDRVAVGQLKDNDPGNPKVYVDCVVVADTYIGPEVPLKPKGSIVIHAKLAGVT
jgi:DNA-directed RNA polymerase subunit RPC12/RpoP